MTALKGLLAASILMLSTVVSANQQQKDLTDTVNSFMIENYNYVLNINLLIELCAMERYLDVDTNSSAFNTKLQNNIKQFAELQGVTDYSANNIAADVEVKFKSFLQGVRYGGFIADNFIRTRFNEGVCTPEIQKDLEIRIAELVKTDEFKLSEEY